LGCRNWWGAGAVELVLSGRRFDAAEAQVLGLLAAMADEGKRSRVPSKGVDTLLVAGAMTSGCVRASVVDAMSHGLRVTVISDCVGDRAEGPHAANLFDMEQKYADVMDLDRFREILPAARQ
jgi:nicotinamidase-related amidase